MTKQWAIKLQIISIPQSRGRSQGVEWPLAGVERPPGQPVRPPGRPLFRGRLRPPARGPTTPCSGVEQGSVSDPSDEGSKTASIEQRPFRRPLLFPSDQGPQWPLILIILKQIFFAEIKLEEQLTFVYSQSWGRTSESWISSRGRISSFCVTLPSLILLRVILSKKHSFQSFIQWCIFLLICILSRIYSRISLSEPWAPSMADP